MINIFDKLKWVYAIYYQCIEIPVYYVTEFIFTKQINIFMTIF